MNIAACLFLYGLVVSVLGPPVLLRLTHTGIAPRLGVAAWLSAIASVALSWTGAAAAVIVEVVRNWNQPGRTLMGSCFAGVREIAGGRAGVPVQIGLWTLAALAGAALAAVAWRTGRALSRSRARTHGHARAAHIIGRRLPGHDAVVVDAPERAAYCVAGRPHAVVVTTAALAVLDPPELDAVLAHERAHLTGRHPQLLAALRSLAGALPTWALVSVGATDIGRLLEMCADDAAARAHGSRTLLGGLVALSGPGTVPAGALGAAGVNVLARAVRLAAPPRVHERLRVSALLTAATALIAVGPIVTVLLTATGMALCGPMSG